MAEKGTMGKNLPPRQQSTIRMRTEAQSQFELAPLINRNNEIIGKNASQKVTQS